MGHQDVVQGKKVLLRPQRTRLHPEISLGHGGGLSFSVSTLVIRESQGCKRKRRRLRPVRIVRVEDVAAATRLDSNAFTAPGDGPDKSSRSRRICPGRSNRQSLRIWFSATQGRGSSRWIRLEIFCSSVAQCENFKKQLEMPLKLQDAFALDCLYVLL